MEIDLFEVKNNNWSTDTLLSTPGLSFYCVDQIDQMMFLNTYILKTRKLGLSEFVVVTTNFDNWLHVQYTDQQIDSFYKRLKCSYKKIIALDTLDTFDLGFSNETIKYFNKIIKPQGVYKDKTRYIQNFLSKQELHKIALSFPCFISVIPEVRKKVRKIKRYNDFKNIFLYSLDKVIPRLSGVIPKVKDVNFIGSATNSIRIDLVNKLSDTTFLITSVLSISNFPQMILDHKTNKIVELTSLERYNKLSMDKSSYRVNRYKYLYRMMRSKVLLSPPGYGELAFRHGEAMMLNRLLLCESLDSVDILYEFKHQQNCLYYNNLDELEHLLLIVLSDKKKLKEISKNRYETWKWWSFDFDELYYNITTKHFS